MNKEELKQLREEVQEQWELADLRELLWWIHSKEAQALLAALDKMQQALIMRLLQLDETKELFMVQGRYSAFKEIKDMLERVKELSDVQTEE